MKQDSILTNDETAASDHNDNDDDEEDDIVRLARIQALTAAARIAASSSNHSNHGNKSNTTNKWNLSSLVSGASVREETFLEEKESTVLEGHESAPQRRSWTIQQKDAEKPAQFQPQNPIDALKAGWEGILEKSQHKLEEIQKDIKGGVSHISLREQSQNKYHGSNHEIPTSSPCNSSINHHPNVEMDDRSGALPSSSSMPMHHESHAATQDGNTNNDNGAASPSHSKRITTSPTNKTTTTNRSPKVSSMDSSKKQNILQTSIVWKRRSGYGKYSIRNAWEQRKLVLVGSTLQYFDLHTSTSTTTTSNCQDNMEGGTHTTAIDTISSVPSMDKEEEESNSDQRHVPDMSIGSSIPSPATSPTLSQTKQKKDIRQLWEQAKENITQSIDGVKENFQYFDIANLKDVVASKNSHSDSSKQAMSSILPRGTIDLVQDNVAIAVITVTDVNHKWSSNERTKHKLNVGTIHTNSPPTPFSLSIMVKGETKWKLCFETQREQILWLALLTDIVVQKSVDSYNEELIKSSVSGGMITSTAVVSTTSTTSSIPPLPSLELTPIVSKTETVHSQVLRSPGDQKGALWQTESKYSLFHAVNTVNKTNDGPYPEKNPNQLESIPTSYDIHDSKESYSMEPYLIRKIHDWVNRFACKDPKISLSGLNLAFCGFFTNLILVKAFVAESKITLCWLAMMMNFFIGMFILQDPTVSDTRRMRRKCFLLDLLVPSPSSTDQNRNGLDVKSPEEEKYLSEPPVIIRQGFKPNMGSTTLRVANESDPNNANGAKFIRWMPLDHQFVQVRSQGYLSSKKKIPAPASLYELIAVDICHSESQIRQFVKKVNLPSKMFFKDQIEHTWISPDIFVISLAVPTEEPSFSKSALDGGGITVVSIYKMREETRKVLKKITTQGYDSSQCDEDFNDTNMMNAIKLFEKWCRRSPTDERMQGRFKMIPNVHNVNEVGLPSYISKYCGKPVLIKRVNVTGFLSSHPDLNAMEFDITLHPFPYLAKKAMSYLYENVFAKAVISLSYVIEGRDDDELPEALIGDGVKLLRPDPAITVKALDLFNGTSKRSFDLTDTPK